MHFQPLATAAAMHVLQMSALAAVLLLAGCSTSLARQQTMQSYQTSSTSGLLGVVLRSSTNQQQGIPNSCSLHACIAAAQLRGAAASSTCKLQQIGKILHMQGSLILEPLLLLDSLQDGTDRNHRNASTRGINLRSTLHAAANSSIKAEVQDSPSGFKDHVTVHMAASCPSSTQQQMDSRVVENLGSSQQTTASAAGAVQHSNKHVALQVERPEERALQDSAPQLLWTDTVTVTLISSVQGQLFEQDRQAWSVATPVTLPEDERATSGDSAVSGGGNSGSSSNGGTTDNSRQLLVVPLLLQPAPAEEQLPVAGSPANSTVAAAEEQQQYVSKAQGLPLTSSTGLQLWLGRAVLLLLLLGGHLLVYMHAAA